MIYVIVFVAFILTWFFIKITLFLANKNFININESKSISHRKFTLYLRIIAITLLACTFLYMYYFQNTKFIDAIEYCLGIIK